MPHRRDIAKTTDESGSFSRRRRLVVRKDEQQWTFRWEPGDETALIEVIGGLARRSETGLSPADAAVLSHHVRQFSTNAAADGC